MLARGASPDWTVRKVTDPTDSDNVTAQLDLVLGKGDMVTTLVNSKIDTDTADIMALVEIIEAWCAEHGVDPTPARKAIRNGAHWMITPWRAVTFVHAVRTPLKKPRLFLLPQRTALGQTNAVFNGLQVGRPRQRADEPQEHRSHRCRRHLADADRQPDQLRSGDPQQFGAMPSRSNWPATAAASTRQPSGLSVVRIADADELRRRARVQRHPLPRGELPSDRHQLTTSSTSVSSSSCRCRRAIRSRVSPRHRCCRASRSRRAR